MTSTPVLVRRGILAAVAAGGTLAACTLTLPGEDSYFGTADAAGDALSTDGQPSDDTRSADTLPSQDTSRSEAESDAAGDAGGGDAQADSDGSGDAPSDGFDAASLEPAVLQIHYPFESVTVVPTDAGSEGDAGDAGPVTLTPDQSTNHRDAVLMGTTVPTISSNGHAGHALALDGASQQYVVLPSGVVSTFTSMSVSCWINLTTAATWDRLFDFNSGQSTWIYFSPTGWNFLTVQPGTHFAIKGPRLDPEMQLTETLPVSAWHHIAIVLAKPYFFYYLDGVEKYRATTMTLAPKDLGVTTNNWLGRSVYPVDPYLSATIDEFRLYSGALTPAQIQQLASQ